MRHRGEQDRRADGERRRRVLRQQLCGDVTLVAWGALVPPALQAAETLAVEGVQTEVIDPRTLSPLDWDTLMASVEKTGRLVVAHEAPRSGGPGGEIVAGLVERCFYALRSPPRRVAGADVVYPPQLLEDAYLPDVAMTLNNLGVLYSGTQRLEEAATAYSEALAIRRKLAEGNVARFEPDLARTLLNAGRLKLVANDSVSACKFLAEVRTLGYQVPDWAGDLAAACK